MSYASVDRLRTYLSQVPDTNDTSVLLQDCLDRATGIVRDALAAALADASFAYAAWGAASTQIVRGWPTLYLALPPHQAGTVTLVEYQSTSNPAAYSTVADAWLEEGGRLYRAGGWGQERYRVTAVWGYGPVPAAIEELTLELAVNVFRARDKGGFTDIVGVAGGIRHIAGLNRQQAMIVENVVQQLWRPSL